jgi:predicted membrane metal-binding protein
MSYQQQAGQQAGQRAMSGARAHEDAVSGWTVGFAVFAGAVMVMVGIFQMLEGIAALVNDGFFVVVGSNYAYHTDTTTWGWIHLFVGAVVTLAGFAVFSGYLWARIIGMTMALIAAISNFFFIPYYPVWSVLIIALSVVVIFALASYSQEAALGRSSGE